MCNSDYDSSDYDSSDYEESCSGICCPEYDYTLDCGCCPCKGIQVPLIRILTDEMRREIYSNMIDLTPWTSKYVDTNDSGCTETWAKTPIQVRKSPKKKVSSTKKDSKPKVGQKKMKRTQTERTKARQMRKRQDKLSEIASKEKAVPQVKNTPTTEKKSTPVESKLATTRTSPQKKRPKTHFRKTKKPGRA